MFAIKLIEQRFSFYEKINFKLDILFWWRSILFIYDIFQRNKTFAKKSKFGKRSFTLQKGITCWHHVIFPLQLEKDHIEIEILYSETL